MAFIEARSGAEELLAQGSGRVFGLGETPAAQLRQYAVDYGKDGIRANGVNADRVRTGLLTDSMIASRSKARGVSEKEAERRAWATVNKQDKGGKNSGHGRSSSRSAAAKKGWETRRRHGKG